MFASFDYDNDEILKTFIIGQSKHEDSPFEITDITPKEAAQEKDWEDKAKIKIAAIVIVMVGLKTHKVSGVLKEIKIANDSGKKSFS